MALVVDRLPPEAASDADLMNRLVGLINHSYTLAEQGLWLASAPERTDAVNTRAAVLASQTLVAQLDGELVGTVHTHKADGGNHYSLGTLAVDMSVSSSGVGTALVQRVEMDAAAAGAKAVRLEVLVSTPPHPHLVRLADWYLRLGYREVQRVPLDQFLPHDAEFLARPCDVSVMEKCLPNVKAKRSEQTD